MARRGRYSFLRNEYGTNPPSATVRLNNEEVLEEKRDFREKYSFLFFFFFYLKNEYPPRNGYRPRFLGEEGVFCLSIIIQGEAIFFALSNSLFPIMSFLRVHSWRILSFSFLRVLPFFAVKDLSDPQSSIRFPPLRGGRFNRPHAMPLT
jgi:hypothetical protein